MSATFRIKRGIHRITGGRIRGVRTLTSAFFRLDWVEEFAYPLAFLLSELGLFVPMLAYFFIGELVGNSDTVGGDYFTFAAIGIGVTVILQSALSGFGYALQRSQNRGQFELILAEPVPWLFLPVALNTYRTLLGAINGVLVLVIAAFLGGHFLLSGVPEFAVLVILGIGASTAVGILAASLMVVAKRSQPVLTLYGLASSLLGGALFSVDQLPGWLKALSYVIPHTYVISAARTVLMEDPGTFTIDFGTAVWVLAVFNVLTLSVGMWLFARSLQFARREGILGGY